MAGLMQSMLPWLTPANMQTAGTLFSTAGQIGAGYAASRSADSEARQLKRAAKMTRGSAQREAIEERRQARLLMSRGQAVAAASGGGASDVSVVNTLADVAAEGEYRALTALWEGEERATGMEKAASARVSEGRAGALAGFMGGASSLLTGAAEGDWFKKYGPKTALEPIEITAKRIPTTGRARGPL
jgi:hypothetical protein